MSDFPTTVLLIEDNPDEIALITDALGGGAGQAFFVETATSQAAALDRLEKGKIDVVLLDLSLPDGPGMALFERVFMMAPAVLIVLLCAPADEEIARLAVQRGADDYLVKGHVDAHWLPRALRYLIERRATREALRQSEARFRAMSDASPLGIFVSDAQGNCIYTNAAYQEISGLSLEQTLGTNWSMAIHPDDRQRIVIGWRDAVRGEEAFQTEVRFLRRDGSIIWTRLNAAAMRDGWTLRGRVQIVEDITVRKAVEDELKQIQEALFEEKERAQVTLNSIGDAVLTTNLQANVTYLNLAAEAMTGWPREDALGRPLAEVFRVIDGQSRVAIASPALRAMSEDRVVGLAADSMLIRRDGSEAAIEDSSAPIHNRDGKVAGAVIVFHDVSASRAMAQKMSHLAQHDFLTGLPNRLLLTERLSQAIGLAQRHRKQVGLLFLDLDYFKNVNDSLGHLIGDQLLQSVAGRLATCVRNTDTVCRQGGDEFVILLAEIEQPRDAAQVAEKLLASLLLPHLIEGHELHVTLSIGISIYPNDGISADSAMQNADTAMYYAKANGRNNYQFFTGDMNTRAVQRLLVENSLRRALSMGEFELHYQPKMNIASGRMIGSEALLRWKDPKLGMIYPGQFIPIAEECGLIVPIGRWVLREACRQVQAWLAAGLPAVPVSVNISAVEFRHPGFLEGVAEILRETGLPARYLELELTESILMHEAESSESTLTALKVMGLKLAIDDFGTGYSSLSYLNRFPIDTLKIDQSFVRDITSNTDNATIVSAVIGMGQKLKQQVIAEGIETAEQLAFLRKEKCDGGQGFLFSYPVSAENFAALLVD
ncbi:MAG: putative signal transduction protein containing a rane domain, an and a domain [Proteobacteria bacterium]|nr:putative signal transduction protein containing a rane domain, an and a domain [Pseudomonadota bacterium]